jgi:ParB-like chromosome segregation protein Spo0J
MGAAEKIQPFAPLDPVIEAALRASIERFGVIVPVVQDQHGRVLDGNHRARIAGELGVAYAVDNRNVKDDAEAAELARTLNEDRRQLTPEQRRGVVAALREAGHSTRAIAGAVGVSNKTVHKDLAGVTSVTPERVKGADGKTYPSKPREPSDADKARVVERYPNLAKLPPVEAVRLARELDKYPEGTERDKRHEAVATWHRVYGKRSVAPDACVPLYAIQTACTRLLAALDVPLDEAWQAADPLLAGTVRESLAAVCEAATGAAQPPAKRVRRVK